MRKIMIVEDSRKIRDELSIFLSRNGYECEAPDDFTDIIELIRASNPHLVLLDINLPVFDGYHICREIRKTGEIPVIVVTSRDTELDEIMAINLGADDFITKPFNTQILLARIENIMRRVYREAPQDRLSCENFTINLSRSELEAGGKHFELTKNEIRILACLFEKKGSIVSREELMRYLWDSELFVDDNTLTVNIGRLRRKLDEAGLGQVIDTRRGQGYIML